MRKATEDLCWMAHRAECKAAHEQGQTTGVFLDIRGAQQIPVTEETIAIYNLGVSAGVQAVLGQLGHEGYKIIDRKGEYVDRIDDEGKPQNFDEAFTQWLTPPPGSTREFVKTMAGGGFYEGSAGYSSRHDKPADVFERNKHRNFAASSRLDGINMPDPDGGPVDEEEPMD